MDGEKAGAAMLILPWDARNFSIRPRWFDAVVATFSFRTEDADDADDAALPEAKRLLTPLFCPFDNSILRA